MLTTSGTGFTRDGASAALLRRRSDPSGGVGSTSRLLLTWIAGTMRRLADEFVFPDRWSDLRGHRAEDQDRQQRFYRELHREVAEGHVLWGVNAQAVAACRHCDDVIFGLGDGRFAVVHLVWQGPQRPPWPDTEVLHTWDEVIDRVVEHEDL